MKDPEAVEQVIARYFRDPELNVGISFDHDNGDPHLFLCHFPLSASEWYIEPEAAAVELTDYSHERSVRTHAFRCGMVRIDLLNT